MAQIVVIGEILVEIMATNIGQTFLRAGNFAGPYPSGAPAIFADQAARTGGSVALIGCVGKDDFGTLNLDRLQSSGVDTSHVRRHPELPTGSAFVTYAEDGSRSFVFNIRHSAAGGVSLDQVDPAIFADCQFFHVMGSSLISKGMTEAVRRGIDLAKAAGAEISFDPNIRRELLANPDVAEAIHEILAKTNILLPSVDDLKYLFPEATDGEAARQLLMQGIRLVLLKRGKDGSTYFDPTQRIDTPAFIANEIDPTGAGDCFGGTFISSLAQGVPIDRAVVLANAAGSLAVQARGPMEGNSTLAELAALVSERQSDQQSMPHPLIGIIRQNRSGKTKGIYSVCSANRLVLEAAMLQAIEDESLLLIEATSNQVNQFGGYTSLTPAQFRDYIRDVAGRLSFPPAMIVLGGDHLGPNPWQDKSAEEAMEKACDLVQAYATAGFTKIHLDASMSCADDPKPLCNKEIARRAALLCKAAEDALDPSATKPVYVIGTEVPTPGGAQEVLHDLEVTQVRDLEETLAIHRKIFAASGLDSAWRRVIAVVVQPGVEFGDASIVEFDPKRADGLARAILKQPGLVFEAHSTDYQTTDALQALVKHHFAFLKVGPELTFAMREAIVALAQIESTCLPSEQQSNVLKVIEQAMLDNPCHWRKYYHGTEGEERFARFFSLSDRIRYYWPDERVAEALARLLSNLTEHPAPLPLLSQYLPNQFVAIRQRVITNEPRAIIRHKVRQALLRYAQACGLSSTFASPC